MIAALAAQIAVSLPDCVCVCVCSLELCRFIIASHVFWIIGMGVYACYNVCNFMGENYGGKNYGCITGGVFSFFCF